MAPDSPTTNDFTSDEGIDLLYYWYLFWRNKFRIIALGFVFAIPTAYIMNEQSNIYRSTASLLIEENRANITSIQDLYGNNSSSRNYTNTQYELIKSRHLAEIVIKNMGLMDEPEFIPPGDDTTQDSSKNWRDYLPGFLSSMAIFQSSANTTNSQVSTSDTNTGDDDELKLNKALNSFSRNLRVSPINNTSIVRVTFTANDPQLAADIANNIANTYIKNDMEQRLFATQQASFWLSERVAGLNASLQESERKLQDFLDKEQLVNISGVSSLNIQTLDQLNSDAVDASRNRAEAETIYQQVQQLVNPTIEQLLAIPAILNHSSIQTIKSNSDALAQEVAELSKRYGKNHPNMISAMAEQQTIQENLALQVRQLQASLESDFQSARENETNTLARLERSKAELQVVNRKSFEFRELEREVNTNRELYDMFFTRTRETQETNDLQTTNAVVVDPAVPALYPDGPQRKRTVILALLMGCAFGGGLVFLRDFLDNTIKNHTDIETRLHANVLGVIPMIERSKAERKDGRAYLGFLDDMRSTFAEALRTIRTSITLLSLDKPYKIIAVTSSIPNEGKTTTSINLAAVMGQMSKVLLIDTDLRRPSLDKSIALPPNSPGLSNYLAGNNDLKECLFNFKKANITVMPAGRITPNPLELISSNKFQSLLEKLSTNYDHIILDTPPTQAVSDSLVLGNIADAVVFVTKADSTSAKLVKNEILRLRQANTNVIGVVLNQLDVKKHAAQGYGGYYDTYGYGAPAEET